MYEAKVNILRHYFGYSTFRKGQEFMNVIIAYKEKQGK